MEGYRTRLTGLLDLDKEALAKAIASSVYSRFLHQLSSRACYPLPEMAFEAYHRELIQSDRDPKTIERYWQVITSYQKWLGDRQPDVASAKEFIAKSGSPSCGCGQIYDGSFSDRLIDGDGVTTALLRRNRVKIIPEEDL